MSELSSTGSSIVNAVAYQVGWFACVLGAAVHFSMRWLSRRYALASLPGPIGLPQ